MSHSYILPLLISSSSTSLLATLSQVNRNLYHLARPRLHAKLNFKTLLAVDRYNTENITYAKEIVIGIRAAMALTDSHHFIKALQQIHVRGLKMLDLQDAKNLSDEALSQIVELQWNIEKLQLPPQAGPKTFAALSDRDVSKSALSHFSLQSALYLDSSSLNTISQRHNSLQHVNVAMAKPCLSLTSLFESCPDLRYLDVRWRHAGKENDDLHYYLDRPEYAPQLEFLAISKIHRELNSEQYVEQVIAHKRHSLKEMVIYNDDTLTVELVRRLIEGCTQLQRLTLHHCNSLTPEIIAQEGLVNWGCDAARSLSVSHLPYESSKQNQ